MIVKQIHVGGSLPLSNKQKQIVEKFWKKLSAEKISADFYMDEGEVKNYIHTIKESAKPVPKSFYLILALIPILFFVFLEIGLRVFDYDYNLDQWVEVDEQRIGLNPDAPRRYFYSTKSVPESIKDVFLKDKPENSYRIFVLGGSSAVGFPYSPNGSFSRYVRDRLNLLMPDKQIEVVNIALTAVNSYTIKDFFAGVVDQQPDLILIYAGHNEYYGALGVGSQESLGNSPFFINLVLSLNKFKTTQLIRDLVKSILSIGSDEQIAEGTLMSRMAQNQSIEYNSDIFNAGIEQFKSNMNDVLESASNKNIPVIITTLPSNLADQPPFISKKTVTYPAASEIYNEARSEYNNENFIKADSLFRFGKDLDMLRFRAPEKINNIIEEYRSFKNVHVVDAESLFASLSPNNITGDNLMTDHLHPNLTGYFEIGKLFVNKIINENLVDINSVEESLLESTDSLTRANFHFTKLDSVIADYRIKVLKNDWPYNDPNKKLPKNVLLNPLNTIDSLAYQVVANNMNWEKAQRNAAAYYLSNNDIESYLSQMNNLINQFPYFESYYDMVSSEMLKRKEYDTAYKYLLERYELLPSAYSAKWIGIIALSKNDFDTAEKYMLQSIELDNSDPQTYYNLAGVYVNKKQFSNALSYLDICLSLDPNFPGAKGLKIQLERLK